MQRGFFDSHLASVEHGAAQEPLDDVLFLVRAGVDVLVDSERAGADMIGDAAQAASVFAFRFVGHRTDLADRLDQRAEDVDVVVGRDALQDGGRALQAHAGVDVLAGQRTEVVGRIAHAVELREDQIPDFHLAVRRVVVDFTTRSADSVGALAGRAGRPEVFVLADTL